MSICWDEQSVTTLYGVGKARESAYARLGVRTVGELLEHYPRAYENRGDTRLLADAPVEGRCSVILTVATQPRVHTIRRGMSLLKFRAYDESGSCEITFFNQNYHKDAFVLGATFRFYGKVERAGQRFAMNSPAFEEIAPDGDGSELSPLFPVYPLTEGLSQKQIAANIAMGGKGTITSCDVHEHKTGLIANGAQRLGFENITARKQDATVNVSEWNDTMDAVICDVPCSGYGIIRKKPDIRYKNPDDMKDLPDLQLKILRNQARYLKKGGVLIYSTCTLLRRENEDVVEKFLAENDEFYLEPLPLPDCFPKNETGMLALVSGEYDTDGFFISRLRRKA